LTSTIKRKWFGAENIPSSKKKKTHKKGRCPHNGRKTKFAPQLRKRPRGKREKGRGEGFLLLS